MIGQLLTKRYLILERLGTGGFSETYLARDKYLPHHPLCVVKNLKVSPESTLSVETAQTLFETEARILDRLGRKCHQIPALLAYSQEQAYQIQEYVEGENLGDWITQGYCLSSREAIDLLAKVLPTLRYIHSQQVIHRDITPSNLIRRPDGEILLIDFGAACISDEADAEQDTMRLSIGTPGYMPPEQEEGASQFNSDLYGLGMSVIHLMTQTDPQQITLDPISGELEWQAHLKDQAIDPTLLTVLERMVRHRSRDRYQTADEVLATLKPRANRRRIPFQIPTRIPSVREISKSTVTLLLLGALARSFSDLSLPTVPNPLTPDSEIRLTPLRNLPLQTKVDQMLITPNDQTLVTADANFVLRLWSLSTGKEQRSMVGHTNQVTALEISPDSQLLISGSTDRTVRLWDMERGVRLRTFSDNQAAVTAVALSPDTRTIASGSQDGTLRLWDRQTGKLLRSLKIPKASITAIAFDSSSQQLISASSDRQIEVWNWQAGQIKRRFVGHKDQIVGLRVKDDQRLFSFGKDRALVWDLNREELVQVLSEDSAKPVAALVDDRYITTVHDNGNIRLWACKTGRLALTISGLGQDLDATLSPDRQYLVSWSPAQMLRVWRLGADP
jgi:serine/threonine protein kinase